VVDGSGDLVSSSLLSPFRRRGLIPVACSGSELVFGEAPFFAETIGDTYWRIINFEVRSSRLLTLFVLNSHELTCDPSPAPQTSLQFPSSIHASEDLKDFLRG